MQETIADAAGYRSVVYFANWVCIVPNWYSPFAFLYFWPVAITAWDSKSWIKILVSTFVLFSHSALSLSLGKDVDWNCNAWFLRNDPVF
jgi:hypothetical protein